jgi:cell division protein FtsL
MSGFMQWVTHGIKRGRFELSSRTALYLLVPVVVLTLVASLYLMLISRTAARGRHIEQLRVELFRLQRENEQLEVQIAEEGTVSRLWERALGLGLAPAEQVEFLLPVSEGP